MGDSRALLIPISVSGVYKWRHTISETLSMTYARLMQILCVITHNTVLSHEIVDSPVPKRLCETAMTK